MTEMAPEQTVTADLSHTPVRDFTLRSAFALAFSDVSPIVGIYSVFGLCLLVAGPAFFWGFPVVLIGQLAVTGVFGDLVSKWPFQGSVYAWARELFGARYGWFANWAYSWGLTIALGAVALFAAEFLGPAVGLNSLSQTQTSLLALGVLIFGSIANMVGSKFLRGLLYVSMTAELISSLGIGVALLFFHRTHSFSFLFSGAGTAHGAGWLFGPFLAIVAFIGFSFVGFESAGSIAEEVQGARHVLPKAISLALLSCGLLVMFATLGLLLALPDLGAVLSGKDTNPIATTLETRLGSGTGRALLVMLTIGFTASMIAVQAAVSRAIWASARARELPASGLLGRLSGPERLPRHVIGLTCIVAGILVFIHNAERVHAAAQRRDRRLLRVLRPAGRGGGRHPPARRLDPRPGIDGQGRGHGHVLRGHLDDRRDHQHRLAAQHLRRRLVPQLGHRAGDRRARRPRRAGLGLRLPARRPGHDGPLHPGRLRPGGRVSEPLLPRRRAGKQRAGQQ